MRNRLLMWIPIGVLGLLFATLSVVNAFPPNSSPWLSRPGISDNTEALEYYAAISAPATLNQWKTAYGFTDINDIDAIYYNAGDLGFGREMHCRKNGADAACYVVNHGLGPAGPAPFAVADAVANQNNLGTVAMVYHNAQNGNPNDVTFYIYAPSGVLTTGVTLDGEGDKYLPNMCLACHGGSYNATNNAASGANFLPFDVESFRYSPQPGYTLADQQEAFRQLNALVRDTNPTPSITELIDGWYAATGGVGTPGSTPDGDFVPITYTSSITNTNLYNGVFKPNCRACHMARTGFYSFSDPANLLGSAEYPVFQGFDMPHAQLTNHNFWNSPAPALLAYSGDWSYRVTRLDDPAPDGCNPGDCSLREAILQVNAGGPKSIITFDVDGVFALSRAGDDDSGLLGDLDVTAQLVLLGHGPEETVIDGGGLDRVFHILSSAPVVIQNVTLQNGHVNNWGGGLYNDGSLLTLNNSVVQNNTAIANGNTTLSPDVPKAISDIGTPVITSTLTITSGGTIADVNVVNLNGVHTYINDLSFKLQSPAGTQVEIVARSCFGEDNFNLHLDDEAAPGAFPCPPNDDGTYQPSNLLSAFDGEDSTGVWALIVTDHADVDGGSLNGWGLEIVSPQASTDVPKAISSTGTPVVTSTLIISGEGGVIADINVINLNGTHTYISDLGFTLQSPSGTQVEFMGQACNNEDNFNINFDDEAAPGAWPCPPTDGGTYQPTNPLSTFDGEASAGTWTLIVNDYFNLDGGSLDSWGLEITLLSGQGNGAGIASRHDAITEINASTIGPNNLSSNRGGGLYVSGSASLALNNSTLSGNSASIGGGLYNTGVVTTTLHHSTLTNNTATQTGGGVANLNAAGLFVRNTIVAGNGGGGLVNCDDSALYVSQGYNLVGQNGDATGCPTTDGTTVVLAGAITTALNPTLSNAPGRAPYHALVVGGPAVDAIPLGANCALPSYDQLDLARPQDGDVNTTQACDIGAQEVLGVDIPISGLTAANNSPTALGNPTIFVATIVTGTNVTYQWNFGDQSPISGLQSPTHTYAALGTYTAIVTATNSLSTVSASTVVTIQQTVTTALLTVTPTGTGSGTVTSTPLGISCPADCSENYFVGTVITLTATANGGSLFSGWGGACAGSGLCVVTLDTAKTVTADFDPVVVEYRVYLPLMRR